MNSHNTNNKNLDSEVILYTDPIETWSDGTSCCVFEVSSLGVKPYDPIAGHFTTCHSLTDEQQQLLIKEAINKTSEKSRAIMITDKMIYSLGKRLGEEARAEGCTEPQQGDYEALQDAIGALHFYQVSDHIQSIFEKGFKGE